MGTERTESPLGLTEKHPLDVFLHQDTEGTWGLYCCNEQSLLPFLLCQASSRDALQRVRCVVRPTNDDSTWAEHWQAALNSKFTAVNASLNVQFGQEAAASHGQKGFSACALTSAGASIDGSRTKGKGRGIAMMWSKKTW